MVDITVVTHTVALPTSSNGAWDVDPTALSGITPKAVMVTLTRGTSAGSVVSGHMFSFGAATASGETWCCSCGDKHAAGISVSNR